MNLVPILMLRNQLAIMRALRATTHPDLTEIRSLLDRQIEETVADLKAHEYRPEDNDPA